MKVSQGGCTALVLLIRLIGWQSLLDEASKTHTMPNISLWLSFMLNYSILSFARAHCPCHPNLPSHLAFEAQVYLPMPRLPQVAAPFLC